MRKSTHGGHPAERFTLLQNSVVRDTRLSFRARGVLAFIQSHEDGWHITADGLADHGAEGRESLRAAFAELVEHGYLRRVRSQDEEGKWRTDLVVYPDGDAPPEGDRRTGSRTSVSRTSVSRSSVSRPSVSRPSDSRTSIEDHEEDSSSAAAAATSPEYDDEDSEEPSPAAAESTVSQVRDTRPFPVVEQRKLTAWFGVESSEAAQAWLGAWDTAQAATVTSDVDYDPQAHLAIYLSRCREERRSPRSDLWLRFFIEDRAKHVAVLQQQEEREERQHEDPQQREDRITKRMPPADWGTSTDERTEA